MIRLYHYPLSPPSEGVRIVLEEKGLSFDRVGVDLPGQEHHTPEFLNLHYRAMIPVLQDGERTIFESNVIAEYLEEAYPQPPLMPSDLGERAVVRQWIAILQLDWHPIRHDLYHEGLLKPLRLLPGPGDRNKLMAARKAMVRHLDALEVQLTRSAAIGDYLLGTYTLADALYTPTLYILHKSEVVPRTYTQVRRWMASCLGRPSAPRWLDRGSAR